MYCSSCSNYRTRFLAVCHATDSLVHFFQETPLLHAHPHHFPVKHEPNNIWVTVKLLNPLCRSSLELTQNTSGQTDVFSPGLVPYFIYMSHLIGKKTAFSSCYALIQASRELWIKDKIQWIAVSFFPNSLLTRNFQSIYLYDTHPWYWPTVTFAYNIWRSNLALTTYKQTQSRLNQRGTP